MTLTECPTRLRVRITAVGVAEEMLVRAHEMGLRCGAVVRVTHHGAFGGVVIAVGAARVAIDGATARCVQVEPVAA
ncbi:MAG: ferrous iron transport protein A [Actinomycetales bacterium]|nr:ferrous iron transport protein A [Actinomycetales bacterium]